MAGTGETMMWCQANKAVTGNQETFWTNMDRGLMPLMQNSVILWHWGRHCHYDVTSWQTPDPDPWDKMLQLESHTPRPRNNSNDFKKTSSITVQREDIQKIPPRLGPQCWGCASPLTRGCGWHVVTMWHPDNIRPGHNILIPWSVLKTAPRTLRRDLVITINADYRL